MNLCPKGHEYTPQNTTYRKPRWTEGGVTRECRKCKARRQNYYRARQYRRDREGE